MLMKLRPGLNFINVLRTAFTCAAPRSIKKKVKFSIFFTLLGSTSLKAVRKMLMKLRPGELSLCMFSQTLMELKVNGNVSIISE